MEYVVVVHAAEEGGFWAEVPALEGCFAQGESVEDVLADARLAIESHLDAIRGEGRQISPGGDIIVATVSVPAA